MGTSWNGDCKGPKPGLGANSDITGTGVVLSYLITAAIVAVILMLYYLMVFDPDSDPFENSKHGHPQRAYLPNPVDKLIISQRIRALRSRYLPVGLDGAFLKCILAFSDMQLLTGFSILITGASQLQGGLSTFNWNADHLGDRAWRIFFVGALCLFLVIGLGFTGNYYWITDGRIPLPPNPSDKDLVCDSHAVSDGFPPAIDDAATCYLLAKPEATEGFISMILAVLLIIFSFISRTVRLSRSLSVNWLGRFRVGLKLWVHAGLKCLHDWSDAANSPRQLKSTLFYFPALALVLTAHLLVEGFTSMLAEIIWLLVAFVWGVFRLFFGIWATECPVGFPGGGEGDWTFGQVIALVLIAGPVLTIIQSFYKLLAGDVKHTAIPLRDATSHENLTLQLLPIQISTSVPTPSNSPSLPHLSHLDFENDIWQSHHSTLCIAVLYCTFTCIVILVVAVFGESVVRIFAWPGFGYGFGQVLGYLLLPVAGLVEVILLSLAIENTLGHRTRWVRRPLQAVLVLYGFPVVWFAYLWYWWHGLIPGCYLLFCLVVAMWEWVSSRGVVW
ncbi:hypothetical protein BO99DRAFT_428251 [Aspergillus violaceofuscus CBS 115571]|uniref:Uncharacterized protein n=1 Tax=Aspergillus violaceofuscus (strain CBS 115571) TaxID=1450538 RepID=A0A2V5HPG7_ASPV1|nr:hypothetical protein BO99DRAFT_428251 [Aspergillus violaceofuscus CBS 115571]